jgi:hypothetical protein
VDDAFRMANVLTSVVCFRLLSDQAETESELPGKKGKKIEKAQNAHFSGVLATFG